ncbi:HYR domain-containing protein [Rasiella sp. SM2506]|uniref:HYR domain-containing protein n=1 Tax=Rasiella sp. SM2506 TaxID=3423914 RepID=UPI003D7B78C0
MIYTATLLKLKVCHLFIFLLPITLFCQIQGELSFGDGFDILNPDEIIATNSNRLTADSYPITFQVIENISVSGMTFSNDGTFAFFNVKRSNEFNNVATITERIMRVRLDVPFKMQPVIASNRTFYSLPNEVNKDTYAGVAFNPEGTKMYVLNKPAKILYTFNLPTPYAPNVLTSLESIFPLNIPGGPTSPKNFTFSNDGKHLYVVENNVGSTGNCIQSQIHHYTLTQPFLADGTNAVLTESYNTGICNIVSFKMSNDGSKIIALQDFGSTHKLYQFSLETPFSLASGVSIQDSMGFNFTLDNLSELDVDKPHAIAFNKDGTELNIAYRSDIILTSGVFQSLLSAVLELPIGDSFYEKERNDGSVEGKMNINLVGNEFNIRSNNVLLEDIDYTIHNLPAGLDPQITTASDRLSAILTFDDTANNHEREDNIDNLKISFTSVAFNTGNSPLNSTNVDTNVPITFRRGSSLAYGDGFNFSPSPKLINSVDASNINHFTFSADGTKMYSVSGFSSVIVQWELSVPFDISTRTEVASQVLSNLSQAASIALSPDGGTLVVSSASSNLVQFQLTTPFDVNTAQFEGVQADANFGGKTIQFNHDGTLLYYTDIERTGGTSGGTTRSKIFICQQKLLKPFDVLILKIGASNRKCSIYYDRGDSTILNGTGFFIDGNEERLFLNFIQDTNLTLEFPSYVQRYKLTTPEDVTTKQPLGLLYLPTVNKNGDYLMFNPAGTRMYTSDPSTNLINQYDLNRNTFKETSANTGIVEGSQKITLYGGELFKNAGATLAYNTNYSISNLPSGLTPVLTVHSSGNYVTLTLDGTAIAHEEADNVDSLIITFKNSAFVSNDAGSVSNASAGDSRLSITFINTPPTIICKNTIIELDASGIATVIAEDINNGSIVPGGIASLTTNKEEFTCANRGDNIVILTLTDNYGNVVTCNVFVTVIDAMLPTVTCKNTTIFIGSNGTASIKISDIENSSADNCAVTSKSLSKTLFDCSNIGTNTVTLSVRDASGNIASCTATVIVEDGIDPTAVGQNITVQLDATGTIAITAADVDGGSTDNCAIDTMEIDIDSFDCTHVGTNIVTLTVTDLSGNTATSTATVTVEDNIAPIAICQDITVQLDANGNASIVAGDIDGGSSDTCGIENTTIDITDFTCADVGTNNVTLTVTDVYGNMSSCTAIVTVEDNVAPVAVCMDISIQLDANGNASIVAADVDGGSSDNCGIASTSIDTTDFTCADVGPNNVILTVTDVNGNSSYCTAVVTVVDNIDPIANCAAPFTIQLDANGNASITVADIDNGSTDTCGIANTSIDKTDFTCADVGPNNVTLTVTDVNGNSSSCVAIVTVQDTIDPLMNCPADFTVGTDIGICGATVSFADPIPIDTCGIASLVQTAGLPSGSVFPVGSNVIEYTATDVNGNTTSCSFTITVVDDEAPTAVCMDITIQLDAAGNATILPTDVDGGSTDNCAMDTLSIDINTFSCADIGTNNVVLTVTDTAGNTATCTAIVTVEDLTPPTVVCQDITVTLDATGVVIIDPSLLDGGSTDACGGLFTYSATPDTFTCAEIGDNSVTLTVTEAHGNSASCEAIVTVVDNTPPILVCQDITVPLGANGMVSIVASDVIASVDDACGISATGLDIDDFSCDDLGIPVTVTVFASDVNGNLVSCTAIVTVVDELGPQFDQGSLPEDQVRMADGNGEYILEDFTTNVMVTDNCSVRNAAIVLTQDPVVGTVLTVGVYDITLSVEDDFGNMASYVFELEVVAPLGVGENNFDSASLTMYPNPATDFVLLSNPQNIPLKEVSIYDVTGRLIKKVDASATTSEVRLDVSELASATYMILINTEAGQVIKQLVKE